LEDFGCFQRLSNTPTQDKANLEHSLFLARFVNVEIEEPMYGVGLSSEYEVITPSHISSIYGPLLKPFAVSLVLFKSKRWLFYIMFSTLVECIKINFSNRLKLKFIWTLNCLI